MRKLGVGVLGVGEMGKRHAENLRRLVPEARLVAVADAFPERARQVANELEIDDSYASLEAMLERKEVDAVLIATPDKFRSEEHTSELQSHLNLVCRLLLEKKKNRRT